MSADRISVQDAVKASASISYVSEKLGVSRPTLYRYMEQFEAGSGNRIPAAVRDFFVYVTESRRSEEDVILYFMRSPRSDVLPSENAVAEIRTKVITGSGKAMILFPDLDPETVSVALLIDFDGERKEIGEFRPDEGRRYVTIGDLVPGQGFYYRVVSEKLGLRSRDVYFKMERGRNCKEARG